MRLGTKLLYLVYFFVAGVAFDLITPLLAAVKSGTATSLWSTCQTYLSVNAIALLLCILIVVLVRNQFAVYPLITVVFGLVGYVNSVVATVGIITVVWHGAIGLFAGLALFFGAVVNDLDTALTNADSGDQKRILSLKEDLWSIMKSVMQILLTFAIVTGVCMTILFGPGYEEFGTKLNAIQMVTGFGFCVLAVYLSVICPCLRVLSRFRQIGY